MRNILLILWKVKKKIVSFSSYRLLISTTNVPYSRIIPKTTLQEESIAIPDCGDPEDQFGASTYECLGGGCYFRR